MNKSVRSVIWWSYSIAASVILFQFCTPAEAQSLNARSEVTVRVLDDRVTLYERPYHAGQTPSFWELLGDLFRERPTTMPKFPFEHSTAFLVGVGNYSHMKPLLYVRNDIERLRDFLLSAGGFDRVYVGIDEVVSYDLIETYMMDIFRRSLTDKDRLLFYFSGHGDDDGGGRGYLLFGKAAPDSFGTHVLPVEHYKAWSDRLRCKHILFVFDACASGLAFLPKAPGSGKDRNERALMDTLSGSGSRDVITAGTAKEKTYQVEISTREGHSVFTDAFLHALTKPNPEAEDPFLTIEEVFGRAEVEVGRFAATWGANYSFHPQHRKIDTGQRNGTFLFVNTAGRVQQPSEIVSKILGIGTKNSSLPSSLPDYWDNPTDKQRYRLIPAGNFDMGCAASDVTCSPDDKPPKRTVIEQRFYIAEKEVTVEVYKQFVGFFQSLGISVDLPPSPSLNNGWTRGDEPIVKVTWKEATDFCQWAGGRLPTNSEWEYAARGGSTARFPWGTNGSGVQANFGALKYGGATRGKDIWLNTAPVGRFGSNKFGLFDVAGNAAEWTADEYQAEGKTSHAVRGGSWYTPPTSLGYRLLHEASAAPHDVGFRCVIEVGLVEKAHADAVSQ